jgi:hypothetical protein
MYEYFFMVTIYTYNIYKKYIINIALLLIKKKFVENNLILMTMWILFYINDTNKIFYSHLLYMRCL